MYICIYIYVDHMFISLVFFNGLTYGIIIKNWIIE